MAKKSLTVWLVTDNKPGHRSQLEGLLQALADRVDVTHRWISCDDSLWRRISQHRPPPDLVLAAGHRSHFTALLLKWCYGGKLVVLMKPSLPLFLFDLCVIPEHDGVPARTGVISTCGALNPIRLSSNADSRHGLLLIGGPSKHHDWSSQQIMSQLRRLKTTSPEVQWTLTTSRRTPDDFVDIVRSLVDDAFTVVPVEDTNRAWLLDHYQHSGIIWVTEDSVSMVYESLSAGAQVGVLVVPRYQQSRISQGFDQLLEDKILLSLPEWLSGKTTAASKPPLNESARIAGHLIAWLQ